MKNCPTNSSDALAESDDNLASVNASESDLVAENTKSLCFKKNF